MFRYKQLALTGQRRNFQAISLYLESALTRSSTNRLTRPGQRQHNGTIFLENRRVVWEESGRSTPAVYLLKRMYLLPASDPTVQSLSTGARSIFIRGRKYPSPVIDSTPMKRLHLPIESHGEDKAVALPLSIRFRRNQGTDHHPACTCPGVATG